MVDDTSSIGSRLDRLFSARSDEPASISAVARGLGVSRDTVRRMRQGQSSAKGDAALRAAERREARRPQWVDSGPDRGPVSRMIPTVGPIPAERDIRAQLELVAIRTRAGRIDREATGRAFGVSGRTISRWLNGTSRPTMAHQDELRREVRSHVLTNSPQAMEQAFAGGQLGIAFRVRVSADTRSRHLSRAYDPQTVRDAQGAWLAGGEAGLSMWLAEDLEANYFGASVPDAEVLEINDTYLR